MLSESEKIREEKIGKRKIQMATLPPKRQLDPLKPSSANMAVAQSAKPKAAPKAGSTNPKAKTQLHRRSRSG